VAKQLKIKLIRSPIGRPQKQRDVLRGLGLRKMNRTVCLQDTVEIRGMVNKVAHLVSVQECEGDAR
jgi:large subunit ribosomal protein L30